ncbi:zinc finger protein SNAI2-like [Mugil cephalus]|uniref:zinc finger protein SNAI2-like n=1 Tax=Mugil cephalus TaxID=48193 RepID=UPI001FB843CE|nr:zinc finger protein SNAI2-like [Mugil cephalus]
MALPVPWLTPDRVQSSSPSTRVDMPRSFLVKKHQSAKKHDRGAAKTRTQEPPCSSHEDSLLHSDIHHHHPASDHWLHQKTPSLSLRGDRLPVASSPNTSPLSVELYSRGPADAYKLSESCTQVNLPLLDLFPAVPLGDSSHESFGCLDCHKDYLSFSGLAKHKQWGNKKSFSCKYCEKEYVSLGALKMHIRTHTLPCVCKLCGKAFSRPWLLQGHIRTHTGEKPFSCLHCSRAFADRSNLRAHLQTHSEVKKYQCTSCFKTFSRISLLSKHQEAGCPLS